MWNEFHLANQNIIQEVIELLPRCAHNFNIHSIITEWDEILNAGLDFDRDVSTDTFWYLLSEMTTEEGEKLYDNISKFALHILVISSSNTHPERVWSKDRQLKPKLRNRLNINSINAQILITDSLRFHGYYHRITNFQPSNEMLTNVINKLYNRNHDIDDEDDHDIDDENDHDIQHENDRDILENIQNANIDDDEQPLNFDDVLRALMA